jgi:two-component system CheB/CheR fusion protein
MTEANFHDRTPDPPRREATSQVAELLELALAQQEDHAIILLDTEARVVAWLPGATRTFGYRPEEMMGQTLTRLFTPEDLARGDLDWELQAARSYGKAEDDRWQVRQDGVRIWVAGIMTALRDEAGEPKGFVKILRDRTDLRGHIATLQGRLHQADQSQKEKHVLLGTLAHELRNPLGPLRSATQLIAMAASDKPRVNTYVQIIERQIRFIDSLLKDLLESARVGVGKLKLNYSTFDLDTAIHAAVETCSALLRDRRQAVEVIIPNAVTLEADSVRLQQVIINLLTNASKFSPPASSIWIKATVDADELVLRVEDHGCGIPAEMLPKIFDLLTQAQVDSPSANHGLGLGLGLVKSIVEMHGGTVQARSEGLNQGTEISIRLPLRPAAALPSGRAELPDPGDQRHASQHDQDR